MEESGWVIEAADSSVSEPKYWTGHADATRSSSWTSNHNQAIRFARKLDGERVAERLMNGVFVRICEHGWS